MDLFWLMHEGPICWNAARTVNILQFFVLVFLCQIKWICRIAAEWGLWNNSWVKNLPVRPLAPRRKTPGQLYPAFIDLPGWVRNSLKWSICFEVLHHDHSCNCKTINYDDCINTKPGIHCKLTLMIPSSSYASSLLAFELLHWVTDELWTSNATSVVLLCLRKKIKEFIFT